MTLIEDSQEGPRFLNWQLESVPTVALPICIQVLIVVYRQVERRKWQRFWDYAQQIRLYLDLAFSQPEKLLM